MTWIRRLFRRDPSHLRGRVPVECGEGATIYHAWVEGDRVRVNHDGAWSEEPDPVGRAFLQSLPPRQMPERRVTPAEDQHAQRRPDDLDRSTLMYRDGTPYEVRLMMSGGMACRNLGMMVEIRQRPSPAENARRYTSEEETW